MKKKKQPTQSQLFAQIAAWYHSPLGQQVLQVEQRLLSPVLSRLFGYYLLQIGGIQNAELVASSPIAHKMHLTPVSRPTFPGITIEADLSNLPLAPESVDVIVLPHVLEFVDHPSALLARLYQALIPEGHLVILGFNPYSLWGLSKPFLGKQAAIPWSGKFVSMHTIRQQLSSMAMTTPPGKTGFFRPPISRTVALDRLLFYENMAQLCWPLCGGLYLLQAKKMTQTLTPQRKTHWMTKPIAIKKNPALGCKTRVSSFYRVESAPL